jgi:hypothetical protein
MCASEISEHCTCTLIQTKVGKQTFVKVRKSPIREFLGSFRYRKSTNFLRVPVRKSQIRKGPYLLNFRKSS